MKDIPGKAKRLVIWFCETLTEAVLLTLILTILWSGPGQTSLTDDLLLVLWGTVFVFMVGSGYLLTTALFTVFLRSQKLLIYSLIAPMLFIVHEQLLFTGWKWPPDAIHLQIQSIGAGIVFGCTLAGSWLLRKWKRADGK